ncbi:MAG: hypothetical protein ABIR78_07445 [Ferruginibacter sp.]
MIWRADHHCLGKGFSSRNYKDQVLQPYRTLINPVGMNYYISVVQ